MSAIRTKQPRSTIPPSPCRPYAVCSPLAWSRSRPPSPGRGLGNPGCRQCFSILAALTALSGFENIAIVEFRRNLRFDVEFALQILPRVLQVAVAIVAALLLRSYWALLIAISVSKILSSRSDLYGSPSSPAFYPSVIGVTCSGFPSGPGLAAWPVSPGSAATHLSSRRHWASLPSVCIPFGSEIGGLPVSEFIAPAASALFPGFAEARRRGDRQALAPMAVVAFLTLLIAPLAIAISASAGPVVTVLLGPRWIAARPLVAVLAISCAVSPFGWVSRVAAFRERPRRPLFRGDRRQRRRPRPHAAFMPCAAAACFPSPGGRWGVFFFEAAVFAVVLRMSGELRVRDGLGGHVKTLLASVIAMAAVWATGWGWHDAASTRVLPAIVEGAGISLFVIAVFVATLSAIWWLAGAPEGPETRLAAMLRLLFYPPERASARPEIPSTVEGQFTLIAWPGQIGHILAARNAMASATASTDRVRRQPPVANALLRLRRQCRSARPRRRARD